MVSIFPVNGVAVRTRADLHARDNVPDTGISSG